MLRFVFPSDYFNPKKVDEAYREQVNCLRDVGFKISLISLETLVLGKATIFPMPEPHEGVIYRGWMLTPGEYSYFIDSVKNVECEALISHDEYKLAHYLPSWYSLIHDLTPETRFMKVDENLELALSKLGWSKFFVKDYVKSLKTSVGAIINDVSAIRTVVAQMYKFRGSIEGGLCVRQFENFVTETEKRYFVINGKSFAALPELEIPEIVEECARRINSSFFSVDVIERTDGCKRIVEIGDGQVSDLVDWWTAERFAEVWLLTAGLTDRKK